MKKTQFKIKNKKTFLNLFIPQVIAIVYITIFTVLFFVKGQGAQIGTDEYNYFGYWNFFNDKDKIAIPAFLVMMLVLELLSTTTFQLRLWLTSKDKISQAAGVGATSWMIAGLQGILLIGGSNDSIQFLIKMLPVGIATYTGIYMNNLIYKTRFFKIEKE